METYVDIHLTPILRCLYQVPNYYAFKERVAAGRLAYISILTKQVCVKDQRACVAK